MDHWAKSLGREGFKEKSSGYFARRMIEEILEVSESQSLIEFDFV